MTLGHLSNAAITVKSPAPSPLPNERRARGFWPRIAVVGVLSVSGYIFVISEAINDILAGSRGAFVVVLPILTAMIAAGYRYAPRGVSDSESDWIIAILGAASGLTAVYLLRDRLPTLTGLWRIELIGVVVWVAASAMVMFGVRYVTRMFDMWLFAFGCASPLPFLLTGAQLGGSDAALAVNSAALGAVAVYLAGRTRPMPWRLGGALLSCATGAGAALLTLAVVPGRLDLPAAVVIGAGAVPLLTSFALLRFGPHAEHHRPAVAAVSFPHRSKLSILALVALTGVILVMHPPTHHRPGPPMVIADWTQRSGLRAVSEFGFIASYLGPGAELRRFATPAQPDFPAGSVDVITTPGLGALRDFGDAIWYPSDIPIDYQPATVQAPPTITVRSAHTDSDAAVTEDVANWYALSWVWRTPSGVQQVNVVVAQSDTGQPPDPIPPTLSQTMIRPAAWIARQQPDPVDHVDERIVARANQIARQLMAAAGLISA